MNLSDDDFTLFDLEPRFALDGAELDERRRALQAQVHPDRFAADGAAAQRLAMQWAVRVNEAYQRLKDPLSRAAYLCALRGAPVNAEDNTAMPKAFLMQQMLWREELEDARDEPAVLALQTTLQAAEQAALARTGQLIDEHNNMGLAAQEVRALMFLARFQKDLDKRLDALEH
jgi:molecular chaperone HscB